MTQYKVNNAVVRIHGIPDEEKLKVITQAYLKKAIERKGKNEKNQKSIT